MGGWVRRNSNVVRILKSFGNYGRPLRDTDIRRKLLKESQLTLARAVSKAVACEAFIADRSQYEQVPPPSLANKVSQSNPMSKGNAGKCRYCGRHHTRGKQHCLAAESQCSHCHKMGHFAAVCLRTLNRLTHLHSGKYWVNVV